MGMRCGRGALALILNLHTLWEAGRSFPIFFGLPLPPSLPFLLRLRERGGYYLSAAAIPKWQLGLLPRQTTPLPSSFPVPPKEPVQAKQTRPFHMSTDDKQSAGLASRNAGTKIVQTDTLTHPSPSFPLLPPWLARLTLLLFPLGGFFFLKLFNFTRPLPLLAFPLRKLTTLAIFVQKRPAAHLEITLLPQQPHQRYCFEL